MRRRTRTLTGIVIGGGVAGLAAARALQDLGHDAEVLERSADVGGLARTETRGGYFFDCAGHLLHLARHSRPSSLPYAGLRDDEWQQVDRRSYCLVDGRLVRAPIQYHMGDLPPGVREACMASFRERPCGAASQTPTFHSAFVRDLGNCLAERVLIPLNEKTLGTGLSRLSADAARRFLPPPDERRVRDGMTPGAPSPPVYNSRFWYPRQGGISRLPARLAREVKRVTCSAEVVSVDLLERRLRTAAGREVRWDVLLSSMPLPVLCGICNDVELRRLGSALTHGATICLSLGLRGPVGEAFGDALWVYVPDRALPFYRVGVLSRISAGVCPPGCASVYVEVGVSPEGAGQPGLLSRLARESTDALHDLGWVRKESIACRLTQVLEHAYVHLTPEREQVVPAIMARLEAHEVYPIGRYGCWDYMSMEESLLSGIDTARRVAG